MTEVVTNSKFVMDQLPDTLELTEEGAFSISEAKFRRTYLTITSAIGPDVNQAFKNFTDPNYNERRLEEDVARAKEEIAALSTMTRKEAAQAFGDMCMGLFVSTGMDHEPRQRHNFRQLLSSVTGRYKRMAKMNDDELRDYLRVSDKDDAEITHIVYAPYTNDATVGMLLHLHRNPGVELGADELAEVGVDYFMDAHTYPPSERNLWGLNLEETQELMRLVSTGWVKHANEIDGQELIKPLWPACEPGVARVRQGHSVKVNQFVLRHVTEF